MERAGCSQPLVAGAWQPILFLVQPSGPCACILHQDVHGPQGNGYALASALLMGADQKADPALISSNNLTMAGCFARTQHLYFHTTLTSSLQSGCHLWNFPYPGLPLTLTLQFGLVFSLLGQGVPTAARGDWSWFTSAQQRHPPPKSRQTGASVVLYHPGAVGLPQSEWSMPSMS